MQLNNEDTNAKSMYNEPESDIWQELLGSVPAVEDSSMVVQPLASDPWNALLHAQGIEIVDLQKGHLSRIHTLLNEQDVEQVLHVMQEQDGVDS